MRPTSASFSILYRKILVVLASQNSRIKVSELQFKTQLLGAIYANAAQNAWRFWQKKIWACRLGVYNRSQLRQLPQNSRCCSTLLTEHKCCHLRRNSVQTSVSFLVLLCQLSTGIKISLKTYSSLQFCTSLTAAMKHKKRANFCYTQLWQLLAINYTNIVSDEEPHVHNCVIVILL